MRGVVHRPNTYAAGTAADCPLYNIQAAIWVRELRLRDAALSMALGEFIRRGRDGPRQTDYYGFARKAQGGGREIDPGRLVKKQIGAPLFISPQPLRALGAGR